MDNNDFEAQGYTFHPGHFGPDGRWQSPEGLFPFFRGQLEEVGVIFARGGFWQRDKAAKESLQGLAVLVALAAACYLVPKIFSYGRDDDNFNNVA